MKSHVSFALAALVCGLLLHLFPYNETKLARLRLERQWDQHSTSIKQQIAPFCGSLTPQSDSIFSNLFLSGLGGLESFSSNQADCSLLVLSASDSKFALQTFWVVSFQILSEDGTSRAQETYRITTPSPLCLLPIVVFLLALFLNHPLWGLSATFLSYVFLLSGANLIQSVSLFREGAKLIWESDQTFFAFLAFIFWLSINRALSDGSPHGAVEKDSAQMTLNRCLTWFIGLWNPVIYTFLGRFLIPAKKHWIPFFLNSQFLLACLSLYLLSFGFDSVKDALEGSILIPRYFTFAVLVFFVVQQYFAPQGRYRLLWRIPHFNRAAIAIIVFESLAQFFPQYRFGNTLIRIGAALVFSEIVLPHRIPWQKMLKSFIPWSGLLVLSSMVAVLSQQAGILDLLMIALDPRKHPSVLVFYTFLLGSGLGFVAGSFSAVYFIFDTFMKSPQDPLLTAAMLDGIIAGCLLSPFSLFNLLPSLQFSIPARELIHIRVKQLMIPMLLGTFIYAIGAIHSVAILRPVTFVFGCMVVFAIQLKRSHWMVRRTSVFS